MRQVAVVGDLQGQGIGTALVKRSEAMARELGFRRMILHARETAVAFYEKLGYTKVGEDSWRSRFPIGRWKNAWRMCNADISGIIDLHECEAGNGHGERNANQGQLQRLGPGKCVRPGRGQPEEVEAGRGQEPVQSPVPPQGEATTGRATFYLAVEGMDDMVEVRRER